MKRVMFLLIGIMMAGGMAVAEAGPPIAEDVVAVEAIIPTESTVVVPAIENPAEVVFDVEGTELSVSDCNAVQGLGPCNVWEDGNKGYYRPGTVSDADSPEIQAIRKAQLKQSAHEMVDIAEEFPGTWKDVVIKVGVYFLHKMIDLY